MKDFENAQKDIIGNPQTFFVLYCTKRRCAHIKPQLKVKIEDGREAPYKPSINIFQEKLNI